MDGESPAQGPVLKHGPRRFSSTRVLGHVKTRGAKRTLQPGGGTGRPLAGVAQGPSPCVFALTRLVERACARLGKARFGGGSGAACCTWAACGVGWSLGGASGCWLVGRLSSRGRVGRGTPRDRSLRTRMPGWAADGQAQRGGVGTQAGDGQVAQARPLGTAWQHGGVERAHGKAHGASSDARVGVKSVEDETRKMVSYARRW